MKPLIIPVTMERFLNFERSYGQGREKRQKKSKPCLNVYTPQIQSNTGTTIPSSHDLQSDQPSTARLSHCQLTETSHSGTVATLLVHLQHFLLEGQHTLMQEQL